MKKNSFNHIFILLIVILATVLISCDNENLLLGAHLLENNHITGTVYEHVYLSKILKNKRDVFVWLPIDYNVETKYPLLLLHDGQNVFFPGASRSGNEWHLDETVTSLINSKAIEPIIMVGVGNTSRRSSEYSPQFDGELYGRALVDELLPSLEEFYSINSHKVATMGASYGGLISLSLGWEFNNYFNMTGCLSPAFSYKNFNYVDSLYYMENPENLKIAVVNGTKDLDIELQHGVDLFINYLKENNFPEDNLMYWIAEEKSHTELDWADQAKSILPWFFGSQL